MNHMRALLSGLLLSISVEGSLIFAQGTFQNLDFEAASIPPGTPGNSSIPIGTGMPGWSASFNSNAGVSNNATQISYDEYSLGGAIISISDTNSGATFLPLQGAFSAVLFGGGSNPKYSVAISQSGLVPVGTKSLEALVYSSGYPFAVSLGGQEINMIPLSTVQRAGNPNSYTLYGGDVSSFAGQVAQLSFAQPPLVGEPVRPLVIDNINFSTNPIPEPQVWSLLFPVAALAGWKRWVG